MREKLTGLISQRAKDEVWRELAPIREIAIAAPAPPSPWHRIDDPVNPAPKDGTWIWLFYPDACADDQQVVGRFLSDERGDYWLDHAEAHDFIQPTHWMPRPAPPVQDGG